MTCVSFSRHFLKRSIAFDHVSASASLRTNSKWHHQRFHLSTFNGPMSTSSIEFVPTCDLYDEYLDEARVPALPWRSFGGRKAFHGPAVTIKCFEDNSRLKEMVESPGRGRVLVVDAGASQRCAVMGDMLAEHAASNHWVGVIVHGCVRDVEALEKIDVGVVALGCTPRKSTRRGEGQVELPIKIGDVECKPGDFVFCDRDGVLLLTAEQAAQRSTRE